nr:putative capsid protein [Avon-Heathcote Estuary associated circular virus 15]AJP36426.1 putative capsid protein [Avon-Heathcote Estuary associated circular virus 15]
MSKRSYNFGTNPSQQYGVSRATKRRRNVNQYQNLPRGMNQRQIIRPYRLYTPRTPGGQVIAERKYFDETLAAKIVIAAVTDFNDAEVDPAVRLCLFAPTQGNDISNRESRSCFVYSITVRGSIEMLGQGQQTAIDNNQIARLVLVLDKQTNGTQMSSEDLLTTNSGESPMVYAYQNTANFGRFQILKDQFIEFEPCNIGGVTGSFWQGGGRKMFKLKHTFKEPIRVNFGSTNGGTVADIVDNSFHIICGTQNASITTVLNYKSRVSFTG